MYGVPTISKDFGILFANPHHTVEVLMSIFRDGIQLGRLDLLHWDGKSHFSSKAPVLLTPLLGNAIGISLKVRYLCQLKIW